MGFAYRITYEESSLTFLIDEESHARVLSSMLMAASRGPDTDYYWRRPGAVWGELLGTGQEGFTNLANRIDQTYGAGRGVIEEVPMQFDPSALPQKKKSKTWKVVLGVVGAVVLLCLGIGAISAALSSNATKAGNTVAAVAKSDLAAPSAAPSAAVPVVKASPTPPPAPPAPKAPTINEGTWTVGADFPAGTYATTSTAGSECYWAIFTSGNNQSFDSMVDNHLGGGNLRVTLKAGQDFETERCGTWQKVG